MQKRYMYILKAVLWSHIVFMQLRLRVKNLCGSGGSGSGSGSYPTV
jgi:hypothetical protein